MNVFAILLATSLVSATPPVFTAKTIDGSQVHGTLRDWDEQTLTLQEGEQQQSLPLDQLLAVVPTRPVPTSPWTDTIWVTLADGSVIMADTFFAEARSAKASTNRTGILTLPPASVDHVRFREISSDLQERWNEILERKIDQDMLVIASGDSLDHLGGVVRAVREQEIDFELDGDVLAVRRTKVFGIRYYRPNQQEATKPLARLTDDAGSTWSLQQVTLDTPGGELGAETGEGLRITLPLDAIAQIQFAGTGLVYLTDLNADSYNWTPYFGREDTIPSLKRLYRPRTDTALDSNPIVLDGIQYERGLSLHSRTEITYRLPESFERFQAQVGIDDRLRPGGNVHLKIFGDERLLYEASVSGTDSSKPIEVSLKGVRSMTIVADFGSDLDSGDHLILAEARLLK